MARYQDRATGLLRDAVKRMPDEQRASFWRDVVPADPALRALRRRVSSLDGSGDGRNSPSPPRGEGGRRPGEGDSAEFPPCIFAPKGSETNQPRATPWGPDDARAMDDPR